MIATLEPPRLGLAVSGGGDSMALLEMAAELAEEGAPPGLVLEVATVDHGLRPEARAEAAHVAAACARLGLRHEVLVWQGWQGRGNLQAKARAARYRLLAGWAAARGLAAVALGHTADDLAETLLMRLGRGAGLDGLAAMEADFQREGARFLRPLLEVRREDLRAWLGARGLGWCEDPSNADPAFERVRARAAVTALEKLGFEAPAFARAARNLAQAREALRRAVAEAGGRIARIEAGEVVLSRVGLADLAPEVRRKLLAGALGWITGAPYPPRRHGLEALEAAIAAGRPHTLAGCLVRPGGEALCIGREPAAALRAPAVGAGALWDGRWRLAPAEGAEPCAPEGLETRALGEGIVATPWRETGRARTALMASPALWRGEDLVAAPLAGLGRGWRARLVPGWGDFAHWLLSH